MEFTDYAKGIASFIPYGKTDADLFVSIVGNFIKDAAMDNCKLLAYRPDTQYRYVNGKHLPKKEAEYLYKHRDLEKYSAWISECMDDADSYEDVQNWLQSNGCPGEYADDECAQLLEDILKSICNPLNTKEKAPSEFERSLELIKDINKKIQELPRPTPVPVPLKADSIEEPYIQALYDAYGDAEAIIDFSEADLDTHPDYKDDLDDRRIDFYAAVTIERGVMELNADKLSNQFDVLKEETLSGVKDTARRKHPNGYEKMLSVMEHATTLPVDNYLLCKSPYWISGKIKKGVCHHLVNDGKLKWVRKHERT